MTIIVGTSIAKYWRWPGAYDCRVAYVLGLKKLGHRVYLIDDLGTAPLFDADHRPADFESWPGRREFERWTRAYGIWPDCCLIRDNGKTSFGMTFDQAVEIARSADLLININGKLRNPEIFRGPAARAYVDEQPALTQVYHGQYQVDQGLAGHDEFFSFGLNIGTPRCPIPDCGRRWHPFPPPVFLDNWPVAAPARGEGGRFTTISSWDNRATFDFDGKYSGEKSDNWRKVLDLPRHRAGRQFEIAMIIHPRYADDINRFGDHGWLLTDPSRLKTFNDYREFIADSRAEFSIANNRYSQFRTGWFSDRSARYLATGRPVLVQSTGMEAVIPAGRGLLTFESLDEAAAGVDSIGADYAGHCRAARALAEEHFDSTKVMSGLLRQMGLASRPAAAAEENHEQRRPAATI